MRAAERGTLGTLEEVEVEVDWWRRSEVSKPGRSSSGISSTRGGRAPGRRGGAMRPSRGTTCGVGGEGEGNARTGSLRVGGGARPMLARPIGACGTGVPWDDEKSDVFLSSVDVD
jgi:hypothetical protein